MTYAPTVGASNAANVAQAQRSIKARLLDLLVEHGPLDCAQASRLTGIARATVAATLHSALYRGMVSVVPRTQLPADHPSTAAGVNAKSFVYRFESYEPSSAGKPTKSDFEDTGFPPEVATILEEVFMPRMRASLSALGSLAQHRRVVQLPMVSHETMVGFVKGDGMRLYWVPRRQRTLEVKLTAVRARGEAIQYLDVEELSEEICIAAVKSSWAALEVIPRQWRTLSVRLAAVRQSAQAFTLLTPEEQTLEVCAEAQASLAKAKAKSRARKRLNLAVPEHAQKLPL